MKVPPGPVIPIPPWRERNLLLLFFSQGRFLGGRRGDLYGMTGLVYAAEQEQRCGLRIDRVNMSSDPTTRIWSPAVGCVENRGRTADLETPCRLQQSLQVEIGTPSGRSLKDGPPPVGSGPQGGGLRYPAAALSCYAAIPNNSLDTRSEQTYERA